MDNVHLKTAKLFGIPDKFRRCQRCNKTKFTSEFYKKGSINPKTFKTHYMRKCKKCINAERYTGKSRRVGLIIDDFSRQRQCSTCDTIKGFEFFYMKSGRPMADCKVCYGKKRKKYYKEKMAKKG